MNNLSKQTAMRYVIWLLFGLLLSFCTSGLKKPALSGDPILYPSPPDTARIQYLTSISHSGDVAGGRSFLSRYVLGSEPQKNIVKPYGLAVHGGRIYICDSMLGGLEIIDLAKNSFEYFKPGGKGQLKKPINCALDEEGNLYVADVGRKQVVIFGPQGEYRDAIGGEDLIRPTDVAIHEGKIWIADIKKQQILVYARDTRQQLFAFPDGVRSGEPGFLFSPTNLALAGDEVYVTDFGDFRIKIFDLDGEFITAVGSYGKSLGQFIRPKGIAVDRNANLYVVDAGFENVQMFNTQHNLLMYFGGNYRGPGGMWLPAKVVVDYDHLDYFRKYVDDSFELIHLVFVTNQYGPDKINVYGFVQPKEKLIINGTK